MSDHSYLNLDKKNAFSPPVPENLLKKKSAKLVFSSRLFPAWVATAYGALKHKYPDLEPNSASELIALVFQDYCNIFLEKTGQTLAPSRDSLDFLLSRGFVSSQGEKKHQGIRRAQERINSFETTNPDKLSMEDQYSYYTELYGKEKADEIMLEKTGLSEMLLGDGEELSEEEREVARHEIEKELQKTGFSELVEKKKPLSEEERLKQQALEREKREQEKVSDLDNMIKGGQDD